jgi:hypothetical protein
MTVSSVVFAVAGGALFGGLGAIFGFFLGIASALSSIPLSVRNPQAVTKTGAGEPHHPDRLPLTLQNSPGTARALTFVGFASPLVLLLVGVLLLVTHHK